MAKYIIDSDTLTGLADALRDVTGKERKFTPDEMIEEVTHILDSLTYILVDENGVEVPAVFVENEVVFDATANDIRIGKVAVTGDGVTTGTKEIPNYRAVEGHVTVKPGKQLSIPLFSDMCQYTKLQVIICAYNTSIADSVSSEKVAINGKLYDVESTAALTTVRVDSSSQIIELGLANEKDYSLVIRYMIIKEDT